MNLDQNIFFHFQKFLRLYYMGQAHFFFNIVPLSFIILGQNIKNYHMNWFKRTLLPNSRWTKFLGFFTPLEGLIQVLEPQYVQPPSYWPFLAKNWIITFALTLSITFGIPFFQIESSFQVIHPLINKQKFVIDRRKLQIRLDMREPW